MIVLDTNKVFAAMKPIDPARVVRGQYAGYRSTPGVSRRSQTETFVALGVEIDNWRWAGVPFFLRTGKSMAEDRQTISLAFREPPLRMFRLAHGQRTAQRPNELMIEFRDPGSISARFLAKEPGPAMEAARPGSSSTPGPSSAPMYRAVPRGTDSGVMPVFVMPSTCHGTPRMRYQMLLRWRPPTQ